MDNKINTTVERILQFIDFKGISKREFAASVGVSHSLIGKSSSIGSDKLEKILSVYPELDPVWLLSGKGSMIVNDATKQTQGNFADETQKDHSILDNIVSKSEDLVKKQNISEDALAKAMYWFALNTYAKKHNLNVSGNMFGELSSIFTTISDFCQEVQDCMFVEVSKSMLQVLIDKKKKEPDSQEYIVSDEENVEKDQIINEYVLLFNKIGQAIEGFPFILDAIIEFLKTHSDKKTGQPSRHTKDEHSR